MRVPEYLSPTSISKFYADRQEFYLNYLADKRPPRMAQTKPMSIGSAFDAYVKNYITDRLGIKDDAFEIENILIAQVEEENRPWAREEGKYVFDCYKRSGALADLMLELELASETPRFEFTIREQVISEKLGAITLLGKPDIYFKTKDGANVIYDWKVNGYCSKSGMSPKAGYKKIRDSWDSSVAKPSRGAGQPHRDYQGFLSSGIEINLERPFEAVDKGWTDQLCIYSWLLGAALGSKIIVGIEQLVCKPSDPRPLIRCVSHRGLISPSYQAELFARIEHVWKTIADGVEYIFADEGLSPKDSASRCEMLDSYYKVYEINDDTSDEDKWFAEMTRGQR